MKSRFTDNVLTVFKQMRYFTHTGLLSTEDTNEDDVKDLCRNYELDCTTVVHELNEFRAAYRSVHNMVDVGDLVEHTRTDKRGRKERLKHDMETTAAVSDNENDDLDEATDDDDAGRVLTDDVVEVATTNTCTQWIDHSFIRPLRVVSEISSYPHLTVMYKILASL